jgi:hypothetical protein
MDVTLVKVVDPAHSSMGIPPTAGKRLVAVQLRLKNTGTAVYDDAPSNSGQLLDTQGQSFSTTIDEATGCPGFANGLAKIAPGNVGLGCIIFEVPKGTKLAKMQFALDSGFAPETGEWTL